MPKSPHPIRLVILAVAMLAASVATGCGTSDADEERGRVLFVQKCGNCHKLAEAATAAQIGPDLDAAFAAARASGMDSDTIEGVVSNQIENPRPPTGNTAVSMPADIVTGQDLVDVSAYVARWAGVPGAAPPKVPGGPGAQVFANQGCGGCHVLATVNAGGTTGPNLDQSLQGQSPAQIRQSIIDPNAKIVPGYPTGVMPPNYEQLISPEELDQLVQFLAQNASGGGQGGGSARGR